MFALIAGLLAIGTGFGKEAWRGWSLVQDAPSFEAIQGTITHARTRSEGKDQVTDVGFAYTIDGTRYEGDNHATANSYRDAMLASRDVGRYSVNQKITLYVDPHDPARATLSRDVPAARALVRTVYAALFYGIAIFSLITYVRSRKRARVLAHARELERQRQEEFEQRRLSRKQTA